MSSVTPKLDIDLKVIKQAKRAFASRPGRPKNTKLEEIYFSSTLECAIEEYLPHILSCLDEAGMRKQKNLEKDRPRRIKRELWEQLKVHTEEYDVSRIGLVRAALALLATEIEPGPKSKRSKRR